MSYDADDPIIGGDTPFVPASEGWRAFGPKHRPMTVKIEGKEATRAMNLVICAMMWRMELMTPNRPDDMEHREFMRSFIAGANHDLRAVGIKPLLSMQEVEKEASHPSIVAAVDSAKP